MPEVCRIRRFLGTLCRIAVVALSGCVGSAALHPIQDRDTAPADVVQSKVPVASRSATDEIDQLRARIERLEQQNAGQEKTPEDRQAAPGSATDASTTKTGSATDASTTKTASDKDSPSPTLTATWKNGLQISSADDAYRVHIGGQFQFDAGVNSASDAVMFGPGGIGPLEDGATFRRATLRIDGTMYNQISWLVEYNFANTFDNDNGPDVQPIGSTAFTLVWATISELPIVGNLRLGYMKEPLGFSRLTSSRWLNFMERAPGVNSFTTSSPGAMLFNWSTDERVTWAVGIFHPTDNNFGFGVGDGELAETARLTWLPLYADDGGSLLHLGIAASHRQPNQDQVQMRGRPSVRTEPGILEPALADTGDLDVRSQEVLDVELAAVFGPWTVQSEYYATFLHDAGPIDSVERGTLFYQGSYVEVLYFLTGETRSYNRRDGVFDRVIPDRNFRIGGEGCGWGAWQIGVRYAYLGLQDKGINGATLHDFVVGLNWFLNPNTKFQWNLAVDHRSSTPSGSDGFTYIFGTRLAIDF
jgi:phosphate-selective porin OprO/OprP